MANTHAWTSIGPLSFRRGGMMGAMMAHLAMCRPGVSSAYSYERIGPWSLGIVAGHFALPKGGDLGGTSEARDVGMIQAIRLGE